MELLKVDTYMPIAMGGTLILLYSMVLVKVLINSQFKSIILILGLLILSNVGMILVKQAFYRYVFYFVGNKKIKGRMWNVILAVSAFVRDASFNSAIWLFAF